MTGFASYRYLILLADAYLLYAMAYVYLEEMCDWGRGSCTAIRGQQSRTDKFSVCSPLPISHVSLLCTVSWID